MTPVVPGMTPLAWQVFGPVLIYFALFGYYGWALLDRLGRRIGRYWINRVSPFCPGCDLERYPGPHGFWRHGNWPGGYCGLQPVVPPGIPREYFPLTTVNDL